MRSFLLTVCVLLLAASVSFAQCGMKCSAGDKKGGCSMMKTAAYTDARTMPECAPAPVHDFHRVLMPFMEARGNAEPSWIRDNAKSLYLAAKPLPKSKACCGTFNKKAFKSGAKDLVKSCDRLQKMSADKSVTDDAVVAQLQVVEANFVTLSNTCQ